MNPLALYLVKMLVSSGILLGYYWLALRNRSFHQWNRFYLLGSVLLSVVIPFFQFELQWPGPVKETVFYSFPVAETGAVVTTGYQSDWTAGQWLLLSAAIISLIFFISFLSSLRLIRGIIRKGVVVPFNGWLLVLTDAKGTPFSFFRYIFWNAQLDMDSEQGRKMLEHEAVHVREQHSLDKVLMQLLLVPFWINPFFWLIRKELFMIHEFLADKKSMGQHDLSSFAALLLQQLQPGYGQQLTNPFFQSSIKRRLAMLSQNKKGITYLSRIIAFLLVLCVFAAFTIRPSTSKQNKNSNASHYPAAILDTVPKKGDNPNIQNTIEIHIDSLVEKQQDSKKINLVYRDGNRKPDTVIVDENAGPHRGPYEGVIVLDNKVFTGSMNELPVKPDAIELLQVLKGNDYYAGLYGAKAKNGVILIRTKKDAGTVGIPMMPRTQEGVNFMEVEQEPRFAGGQNAWIQFLQKNLNGAVPVEHGAPAGTYRVMVQFIVTKEGKVKDITPLTTHGYGMEEEVVRMMQLSPDWEPARQNNVAVNAYKKQPVTFVIAEEKVKKGN